MILTKRYGAKNNLKPYRTAPHHKHPYLSSKEKENLFTGIQH